MAEKLSELPRGSDAVAPSPVEIPLEGIRFAEDDESQDLRAQILAMAADPAVGPAFRQEFAKSRAFFIAAGKPYDLAAMEERFQTIVTATSQQRESVETGKNQVKEVQDQAKTDQKIDREGKIREEQKQRIEQAYSAFGGEAAFNQKFEKELGTWQEEARKALGERYRADDPKSKADVMTIVLASHREDVLRRAAPERQAELSRTLGSIQEIANTLELPYNVASVSKIPAVLPDSAKEISARLGVSEATPLERRGTLLVARSPDGKSDVAVDLSTDPPRRLAMVGGLSAETPVAQRDVAREREIAGMEAESSSLESQFEAGKAKVFQNPLTSRVLPDVRPADLDVSRIETVKSASVRLQEELEARFRDPSLSKEDREALEKLAKPLKEGLDALLAEAARFAVVQAELEKTRVDHETAVAEAHGKLDLADRAIRSNLHYLSDLGLDAFSQADLDEFVNAANRHRIGRGVGERDVSLSEKFDSSDEKVVMEEFGERFSAAVSKAELQGCLKPDGTLREFQAQTQEPVRDFLRRKFRETYGIPPKFPIHQAQGEAVAANRQG